MAAESSPENIRLAQAPSVRTSLELPEVIFQGADVLVKRLADRGERTSRSELIRALAYAAVLMEPEQCHAILVAYKKARLSDIKPLISGSQKPAA